MHRDRILEKTAISVGFVLILALFCPALPVYRSHVRLGRHSLDVISIARTHMRNNDFKGLEKEPLVLPAKLHSKTNQFKHKHRHPIHERFPNSMQPRVDSCRAYCDFFGIIVRHVIGSSHPDTSDRNLGQENEMRKRVPGFCSCPRMMTRMRMRTCRRRRRSSDSSALFRCSYNVVNTGDRNSKRRVMMIVSAAVLGAYTRTSNTHDHMLRVSIRVAVSNIVTWCTLASHHITSHHITSHHITLHRFSQYLIRFTFYSVADSRVKLDASLTVLANEADMEFSSCRRQLSVVTSLPFPEFGCRVWSIL